MNFTQVSIYQNDILKETKKVNAQFSFDLECNTSYKIVAEKENFTTAKVEFQTNNTNAFEIIKTLLLTPIECNQLVTGKVLNSETNLPLEFAQVSLYQNDILKETKKVNTQFSFDLECNTSYKIVAEKENFTTTKVEFQTTNTNTFETSKTLLLTPIECNQIVNGIILDKETNKPISNALVTIFKNEILIDVEKLFLLTKKELLNEIKLVKDYHKTKNKEKNSNKTKTKKHKKQDIQQTQKN